MNGPAGMGMNPGAGGPVGGPQMNQQQQQLSQGGTNPNRLSELQSRLNTYLYDHLIHSKQYECARTFKRFNSIRTKSEPTGSTPLEPTPEIAKRPDDVEEAELNPHHGEHSFLMDWFCMFWDTYEAARSQPTYRTMSVDYMHQQRLRANMMNPNDPNKARSQMGMNGMKGMQPRNPQQMQAELLQRQRAMQMQRDGQIEGGQRPQTPGSMGDNAPSPSKKPRLDNGAEFGGPGMGPGGRPMGNPMMPNGMEQQMAGFQAGNGQPKMEGMNGMPNPMAAQGMDNNTMEFMHSRALGGGGGNPQDGRHALQDYQLQLMLLEQQNKKRLLQARREQDTISTNMTGPGAGPGSGPGGIMNNGVFAPNMSPQNSRGGGPSPNPADQMKRGTPKLAQVGLPGSPMPDGQQRGSPGGPGFDPANGQVPPGMSANYYQQINTMRQQPQTSHPNFQMQVPGMNAQQIDQMNRMSHIQNGRLPSGQMPPGAQNMAFNAQNAAMAAQQQRQGNMAPPPAPTDGSAAQPPQRAQESSPAQPAAPPTPSQANKAAPKNKETAAQKKKNAPKKGAGATAATPTESADAPVSTPATPMTPSIRDTFPKSGAPTATTTQAQAGPTSQVPQPIDHNANIFDVSGVDNDFSLEFAGVGSSDVLDNFDFDSFLTNDDTSTGFTFDNMDMSTEIGSGNV